MPNWRRLPFVTVSHATLILAGFIYFGVGQSENPLAIGGLALVALLLVCATICILMALLLRQSISVPYSKLGYAFYFFAVSVVRIPIGRSVMEGATSIPWLSLIWGISPVIGMFIDFMAWAVRPKWPQESEDKIGFGSERKS